MFLKMLAIQILTPKKPEKLRGGGVGVGVGVGAGFGVPVLVLDVFVCVVVVSWPGSTFKLDCSVAPALWLSPVLFGV